MTTSRSARARFCLGAVLGAGLALSALSGAGRAADEANERFDIEADRMEVLQERNMAVLTGDVVIQRGEALLKAERAIAFFADRQSRSEGSAQIERMEAEGSVTYETGEDKARGERATYNAVEETVTFHSNVTVTRGDDVLSGCKLIYRVRTGESRMEPCEGEGDGRVRGIFHAAPTEAEPD
jgi:lipopolysaccharide export system protein LptA